MVKKMLLTVKKTLYIIGLIKSYFLSSKSKKFLQKQLLN